MAERITLRSILNAPAQQILALQSLDLLAKGRINRHPFYGIRPKVSIVISYLIAMTLQRLVIVPVDRALAAFFASKAIHVPASDIDRSGRIRTLTLCTGPNTWTHGHFNPFKAAQSLFVET